MSVPLFFILAATTVAAGSTPAPTPSASLNVPELIAQARQLAGATTPKSAEQLTQMQDLCHKLLSYPTASVSQDSQWMPLVENVAVASYRAATDFKSSKDLALAWVQSLQSAEIGDRSERATLSARIWKRFVVDWIAKAPEDVREELNHPSIDLQWGITRDEQQSCEFMMAGLRTKLLDDALAAEATEQATAGSATGKPDAEKVNVTAVRQEFEQCLKAPGTLPEVKAAAIAHYARVLYASGASKQALREIAASWNEILKTDSSPKLLCAAFFINWYGLGDRESARKILNYSDTLCAKGAISQESSDIIAMRQAYYRGLPLTSDELIFMNRPASQTSIH